MKYTFFDNKLYIFQVLRQRSVIEAQDLSTHSCIKSEQLSQFIEMSLMKKLPNSKNTGLVIIKYSNIIFKQKVVMIVFLSLMQQLQLFNKTKFHII